MNSSDPYPVPHKTGLPALAVAGIGCIALLLLMGLLSAGWFFVRRPSVTAGATRFEMIGPDGTVLVTTTTDPDGSEVTTGDPQYTRPPEWVPSYPSGHDEPGGMTRETKDQISGTYLGTTKDAPDKVREYFESTLKAAGFATRWTLASVDGRNRRP